MKKIIFSFLLLLIFINIFADSYSMEYVKRLYDTVDFTNVKKNNEAVVFVKENFNNRIVSASLNGEKNDFTIAKNGISIRPNSNWQEGLNKVVFTTSDEKDYILYVTFYEQIPTISNFSNAKSLINGKPFTFFGIYQVEKSQIPTVGSFGFNLIQNYQMSKNPNFNRKEYLDIAKRNNCYVMVQIPANYVKDLKVEEICEYVASYMNEEATAFWYLFDEPDLCGVSEEYFEYANYIIQKLDPYHTVMSTTWKQKNYKNGIDLDMPQWYHGYPNFMISAINKYQLLAKKLNLQYLPILNLHETDFVKRGAFQTASPDMIWNEQVNGIKRIKYPKDSAVYKDTEKRVNEIIKNAELLNVGEDKYSNYPKTKEVMRGQAILSILAGGNGLLYWLYQENPLDKRWGYYSVFNSKEDKNNFLEVLKELKGYSKVINGFANNNKIVKTDKFWYAESNIDGEYLLFIVNISATEFQASIKMNNNKDKLFYNDNKEVIIKDNILNFNLSLGEGRIYRTTK